VGVPEKSTQNLFFIRIFLLGTALLMNRSPARFFLSRRKEATQLLVLKWSPNNQWDFHCRNTPGAPS
jgi:hypothetical protein